jgi:hypothetical protein
MIACVPLTNVNRANAASVSQRPREIALRNPFIHERTQDFGLDTIARILPFRVRGNMSRGAARGFNNLRMNRHICE